MLKDKINLRGLQLAELEILKEFIRVCNKLKLKYFLDSGTLLGCIRHGGFIPWDDDIDVSMPREDYEIFLKKGQKELKTKYFLQTYNTDKEYTNIFAKIRNSETTFIESTVKNLDINHGIYIDIFPLDGFRPEKKVENAINLKKYMLYNEQIAKKYTYPKTEKEQINIILYIKVKIIKILSNILYGRKKTKELLEKKDKIAKRYKYEDCKYIWSYAYDDITPENHYIPKKNYGKRNNKNF